MTTGTHSAWWLEVGEDIQVAVTDSEMVEFVIDPHLHSVPLTPAYCSNAMLWRQQIVPVMDFSLLFGKPPCVNARVTVAIVAYQIMPGEPLEYVALMTRKPPARITVVDDQVCDLPISDKNIWESMGLALACFSYDEKPTPIINIANLCSESFRKSIVTDVISITSVAS